MGKYMTHLEAADPWRFTLTQWHKSLGITVMFLILLRVIWRLMHKPPALPPGTASFERLASKLTHGFMYLLMVLIPVSGWAMVSASPLNIETLLYGVIHWPHLSFLSSAADKELLADRSLLLHVWFANTLLVLVILHVAAALFHQFYHRDELISRMVIAEVHREARDLNHGVIVGALLAGACALFLANAVTVDNGVATAAKTDASRQATNQTEVAATAGFTAMQLGTPVNGQFGNVQIDLTINEDQPELSSLSASVFTGDVSTGDSQMDATIVTADWFAADEYPQATFKSDTFIHLSPGNYQVTGDLTIKDNTRSVDFELSVEEGIGRGAFEINRSEFGVGDAGQDEFVDQQVVVRFEVPVKGG